MAHRLDGSGWRTGFHSGNAVLPGKTSLTNFPSLEHLERSIGQ
jgi:hypothetical protein